MILSPSQVAKQLNVGLPYIYTLLASGKLKGQRVDGRWQITQTEVNAWREHTQSRRKPASTTGSTDGATEQPLPCSD